MNRTTKALARIGIGAVSAVAVLSTPLALGTASADPSFGGGNLQASASPPAAGNLDPKTGAFGTVADIAVPPVQQGTVTSGEATFYVYHAGTTPQTLSLNITGSTGTAYFPTQVAAAGMYGSSGNTSATCVTADDTFGDTSCKIEVADIASESLVVTVGDSTDSTSTSENVKFNGVHWTQCSQVGVNTYANCTTQGQVNTVTTTTLTYLEGGAPAAGKQIEVDRTSGVGQFSGAQPAGSTEILPDEANCTTDASGKCSFNVVDATQGDNLELDAFTTNATPYPNADAQETITFQAASVAPGELDLDASKVIAPTSQPAGQSAEPGDVIQNTYTLRGATVANGAGSPVCVPAAGASVCPGVPLANTTLTLKVSNGFFTPNCVFPASTNPSALGNNNYANCSFNTAPAAGTKVGDLKQTGATVDVKTNASGQFVVSLGIAKDAGFDDDGYVAASVSDGALVPQIEGDVNAPNSSACNFSTPTDDPTIGAGGPPAGAKSGCNITTEWTTNEAPLNGGTVKDVVIPAIKNPNDNFIASENNYSATDTGTTNVPDVDRVVFALHLTDQFGNLTSNAGSDPSAFAGVEKTGPGNIVECSDFDATNACSASFGSIPGVTQPDGTVTQDVGLLGSYTNNDPAVQDRVEADANTAEDSDVVDCSANIDLPCSGTSGNPGVNDGTQTDTSGWNPEVTTFATFIAGSPAFATYAPQTTGTVSVDVLTINFYNQLAQPVITFSVKPGKKVKTSTAVTAAAKVLDQFNNPITGQDVQFVRSGANEVSCTPIQNATNDEELTNASGVAAYTFSCDAAGTSTVSIVVTGPGGTQLAQGKEAIKFTGASSTLVKEKPTVKLSSKHGKLTVKVKTHPAVHGKTVHVYKLVHGLRHLIGAAKTGKSGSAHLTLNLKNGKTYHIDAKVSGLKASKFDSRYSKTHSKKVKG